MFCSYVSFYVFANHHCHGWVLAPVLQRIPKAILYAGLFGLAIIIAGVIQNYQSLAARKRIFDQPVFEQLSFYGRLDGLGSLNNHIETFLIGKIHNYFFRLTIVDPEAVVIKVKIVPFIDLSRDVDLMKRLKIEHNFEQGLFFGKTIALTHLDLQNGNLLRDQLKEWDNTLTTYGASPITIDEQEFKD